MPPAKLLVRPALLTLSAAVAVVIVTVPVLPRGVDVYAHLLWSWQVLRCLAAGDLPTWLPDLNAGFGSPGIRLYSPLGPLLSGGLGLLCGDAGRGIRAALVLAAALLFLLARRRHPWWAPLLVVLAPAVVFEGVSRFPVSQLLALPLLWALLDRRLSLPDPGWESEGVLLALLWLVHAPTALLVVPILAVLAARRRRSITTFAGSLATAALLAAWHWLPLLREAGGHDFADALTRGDLHPLRNLLGTPSAHLLDHNVALGWAAIGLLVSLLAGGAWRTPAGLLAAGCVFFASLSSAPLWSAAGFMSWFQFPWRLLFPATVLAVLSLRTSPPPRRLAAAVLLLAPLVAAPPGSLAPDPRLDGSTQWPDAGRRVAASFSGNPFLVDVDEHRPQWWSELGPTMTRLGTARGVLLERSGAVDVLAWEPTRRLLGVHAREDGRLVMRLLFDTHWDADVDGRWAVLERWGAASSVALPPGRHTVQLRWRADAVTWSGVAVSVVAALALVVRALRRRYAPA